MKSEVQSVPLTYRFNKFMFVLLLVFGLILGHLFLSYYYYKGYLDLYQYVAASIFAIILIPALMILIKQQRSVLELPLICVGSRVILFLPYVVFICLISEILLQGHLGLASIIAMTGTFIFLIFSKSKRSTIVFVAIATLATAIAILYGVYQPSFGYDTWRDIIQAKQIIEKMSLTGLTITPEPYPIPVIPILYAQLSIVTKLDTIWSSNLMGILYLFLLTIEIYLIAERTNTKYPHISAILALVTPTIVIWSVMFLPQAYAILMVLPILFFNLKLIDYIILTIALILSHGGVALWTTFILIFLTLIMKFLKLREANSRSTKMKAILALLLLTAYVSYTTLTMVLSRAVSDVVEAIIVFLRGEKILRHHAPIQKPPVAILGAIPDIVLTILGMLLVIESDNTVTRLLVFVSLASLGVAYIGIVAFPALILYRYIGLITLVILAVFSSQSLETLLRRERFGVCFSLILILSTIISFGFAGTLMPENPYTANPYAAWSVSGLLTYDEARELKDFVSMLCCNNYLVDWRAGAYLSYKYLWIQTRFRGFYSLETQSFFIFAGSYGLWITPEYLGNFTGILIFRKTSLNLPEVYSPNIKSFLDNAIDSVSVLYASPRIKIYFISNSSGSRG